MRTMILARQSALVLLAAIAMLAAAPSGIADADKIAPADAINHVGQKVTVCGRVASAKFATEANGQPTFLNLDKPYPNHIFTAVIWGRDRTAFPYPPESLAGRQICVTGAVRSYRDKAEIIVSAPSQIQTSE